MSWPDGRRRLAACAAGRLRRAVPAVALAVLLGAVAPLPAPAQDSGSTETDGAVRDLQRKAEADRERARDLREKAQKIREQIRALRSESVAAAKRAQKLEAELSGLESTLESLQEREAEKRAALRDRREQLARTLAALQRIAIQPPEAMAMGSRSPLDVVRGAMILGDTVPAIEERARHLKRELADLRVLRDRIASQRAALRATKEKLAEQRAKLRDVVAEKKALRQKLVGKSKEARQQAQKLARKAADMRELMAKLRAQPDTPPPQARMRPATRDDGGARGDDGSRANGGAADGDAAGPQGSARSAGDADVPPLPASKPENLRTRTAKLARPEDIRPFPQERESLRMPVSGSVVTRYGQKITRAGSTTPAKGIVIETRHGARVVAPYDGKVAYAGPFKSYGRILIIEHGNRYHSLLAGLDRIDAIVGQWVLAGEPVGVMSTSPARTPELYMELRRTGRPINPLPWLAQTGNKVKG